MRLVYLLLCLSCLFVVLPAGNCQEDSSSRVSDEERGPTGFDDGIPSKPADDTGPTGFDDGIPTKPAERSAGPSDEERQALSPARRAMLEAAEAEERQANPGAPSDSMDEPMEDPGTGSSEPPPGGAKPLSLLSCLFPAPQMTDFNDEFKARVRATSKFRLRLYHFNSWSNQFTIDPELREKIKAIRAFVKSVISGENPQPPPPPDPTPPPPPPDPTPTPPAPPDPPPSPSPMPPDPPPSPSPGPPDPPPSPSPMPPDPPPSPSPAPPAPPDPSPAPPAPPDPPPSPSPAAMGNPLDI